MGGVLSKEIFTVTDQGPLADKQISDLVNLIKDGSRSQTRIHSIRSYFA